MRCSLSCGTESTWHIHPLIDCSALHARYDIKGNESLPRPNMSFQNLQKGVISYLYIASYAPEMQ